ncbi:DUF3533 domain-containing protein [Streptomyces sp. NPDC096193]|uniref:DUF3533 domain-containing protein n=1 Tax=Streptomyces sp. NPDC096193 TaxID=3155821 RepID=UPI003333300D
MTRTSDDPRGGFLGELKDAVSVRAALLVLGVLAIQLAFITSYIGAFHSPKPHRIPLAVTAPSTQVADEVLYRLSTLPGEPLDPRPVRNEAAAVEQIRNRDIDGALVLGPGDTGRLLVASGGGASLSQALAEVVMAAEKGQRRTLKVVDVVPGTRGDGRGLSSFYLVVGWCVGGYLCAAILGISAGARPVNGSRAVIRLGALLLYSVVAGLLGSVIAGPLLDALPGSLPALWGLGTLLVFAVGSVTLALQSLVGVIGIGIAILLVVVLGNPSAGGAYPYPLLPPFWRAIGPALPPGAGTYAARSIAYFRGNGAGGPMLVLAAWAVAGTALTIAAAVFRPGGTGAGADVAASSAADGRRGGGAGRAAPSDRPDTTG